MRARLLELADDRLLGECEVDRFRGSGPGGQKRNKTESAVRLRHRPSGLSAIAGESRSQHKNRATALVRLRAAFALELREPVTEDFAPPPALLELLAPGARAGEKTRRSPRYLTAVAALLDLFVAEECSVARTARRLGVSTGALARLLRADDRLTRKTSELRRGHRGSGGGE